MKGNDEMDSALKLATADAVIDGLAQGMSLSAICDEHGMPDRSTVQRWQDADPAFDAAVMRARERGFIIRADAAVEKASTATDAALGRLAFDAERWYLGKLSNAFADNKIKLVGGDEGDAPIRHALDTGRLSEATLREVAQLESLPPLEDLSK